MIELPKAYEHAAVENRWYAEWLAAGYFHAADTSDKPPYCIVIPPPNVTGSLHIGHALTVTIEDILIRWRRMQGYNTLWMPGTDHAGIATQMVVERELAKTGVSRFDLGRPAFVAKVWEWKEKYHARITEQLKVMGVSVDWERERFTMDPGLSRAVRTVFVRMYKDGLIYRANRLVNWSPGIQTVLSDLEVEYKSIQGSLWHIAYPVSGSSERLVVATTRPETMLGDTAVAVHPDDPRYQHLIGKTVDLPLTGRQIPIIGDAILVDMAFGSGAVKVTPAHDFNDFETGQRHGLPAISVLDKQAKISDAAPEAYRGLDRFEARKRIVADLDAIGLLVKTEPHLLNLGHCQRTGVAVEPMLSTQWYVKAATLAEPCIHAVETGKTKFTSLEWEKTFYHWMRNIKDWCISRQLWWGHQIPAWFCDACGHATVAFEDAHACEKCGSAAIRQDEDVLDTWFSSGLWPFSTLGWPEETPALATFYPNAVMETGFDILFFWVARMMMMGQYCMGDVPFRTVYLHPMVRDERGQKMSKTKNNVIDPLDLTATHGADALRFTLAALATQGHDLNFAPARLDGYRAFANKIWNATRFVFMNIEDGQTFGPPTRADRAAMGVADRWILHTLDVAIQTTTEALARFEFQLAANTIYQFFWSGLCDWYIEFSKSALREGGAAKARAQQVLVYCLDQALRLLHPYMPYITEDLWMRLPLAERDAPSLCVAAWPKSDPAWHDEAAATQAQIEIDMITGLRAIRGENKIAAADKPSVYIQTVNTQLIAAVQAAQNNIQFMTGTTIAGLGPEIPVLGPSAVASGPDYKIFLPLPEHIVASEVTRLEKAVVKLDKDIEKFQAKLANATFVANAPPEVVAEQRQRLAEAEGTRATYVEQVARLRA